MKTESESPHNRFALRGRVLLDGRLTMGMVVVEGDSIVEVRTGDLDANLPRPVVDAAVISPGLIDLQLNGAFGLDAADGPQALRGLAARLPETGVTAFLPTLVSASPDVYRAAAGALVEA